MLNIWHIADYVVYLHRFLISVKLCVRKFVKNVNTLNLIFLYNYVLNMKIQQITFIPDCDVDSDIVTVVICNLSDGNNKVTFRCSVGSVSDIVKCNIKR